MASQALSRASERACLHRVLVRHLNCAPARPLLRVRADQWWKLELGDGSKESGVPETAEEAGGLLVELLPDLDGLPLPPGIKRGAFKGLNRLIGSLFDLAAAPIEAKAESVRARGHAQDVAVLGAAKAAADRFGADPALAERAVQHFAGDIVRHQVNCEAVGRVAIKELRDNPPTEDTDGEIDDDWLSLFSRIAENKSNEEMRFYLGKILAGEIQRPGSFSPTTIQTLAALSTREARLFERLCHTSIKLDNSPAYVLLLSGGNVSRENLMTVGLTTDELLELQAQGLMTPATTLTITFEDVVGKGRFDFAGRTVSLAPHEGRAKEFPQVAALSFSRSGTEIRTIVALEPNPEYSGKLMEWLNEHQTVLMERLPDGNFRPFQ